MYSSIIAAVNFFATHSPLTYSAPSERLKARMMKVSMSSGLRSMRFAHPCNSFTKRFEYTAHFDLDGDRLETAILPNSVAEESVRL